MRYRDEAQRNRSRSFDRKGDADQFDAEITRRRQLGVLSSIDSSRETLDRFVIETWAPSAAVTVSAKTRQHYSSLYDFHIAPYLGEVPLQKLRPELIARWQADRLVDGAGRVSLGQALTLLRNILQRAVEAERIATNPASLVRKAKAPRRSEIRPLAPITVELLRRACGPRDATLLSALAYAGLRPSEALALRWEDIRDRTILVQRAIVLGGEDDTKNSQHRTVRLLAPLKADLAEWRMACGRPDGASPVFPTGRGDAWTVAAYQSWRRRSFLQAVRDSGSAHTTPYTLRHSFASLLLHEGRSVIYVARQLGHDARLTLTRYGHVIDELEDQPRVDAEEAIRQARSRADVPSQFPTGLRLVGESGEGASEVPAKEVLSEVEPDGFEPTTSCLQSRRSTS